MITLIKEDEFGGHKETCNKDFEFKCKKCNSNDVLITIIDCSLIFETHGTFEIKCQSCKNIFEL